MKLLELESLLEGGLKELGTTLGPRRYAKQVAEDRAFDVLVEYEKPYEELPREQRILVNIFDKDRFFPTFFQRAAAYNGLHLLYETDADYPAGMKPDDIIRRVDNETVKIWPDGAEDVVGVWLSRGDGTVIVDYDVGETAYPLWASWLTQATKNIEGTPYTPQTMYGVVMDILRRGLVDFPAQQ